MGIRARDGLCNVLEIRETSICWNGLEMEIGVCGRCWRWIWIVLEIWEEGYLLKLGRRDSESECVGENEIVFKQFL